MRRKLITSWFGLLALVGFGILAVIFVPAADSSARTECDIIFTTPERTVVALTCSDAGEDLYNQVFALAEKNCGVGNVCEPALVINQPCTIMDDCFTIAGELLYGCEGGLSHP